MDIYEERILPLFQKSGMSDTELENTINLPGGILYDWKKKRTKSYKKYCGQIAAYFHVSADYLLGNTDDPRPVGEKEKPAQEGELTEEEMKYIMAFRKADAGSKSVIERILADFMEGGDQNG